MIVGRLRAFSATGQRHGNGQQNQSRDKLHTLIDAPCASRSQPTPYFDGSVFEMYGFTSRFVGLLMTSD